MLDKSGQVHGTPKHRCDVTAIDATRLNSLGLYSFEHMREFLRARWGRIVIVAVVQAVATAALVTASETYSLLVFGASPVAASIAIAYWRGRVAVPSVLGSFADSCMSNAIAAAVMFVAGFEGAICLIMALPISLAIVPIGSLLGTFVSSKRRSTSVNVVMLALVPSVIAVYDVAAPSHREEIQVRTSVIVHSDIQNVWNTVVAFPELPPPSEMIFLAGISYPIRATLDGEGVGAIRTCEFNSGAFIEPITEWNPPYRLAFSVDSMPVPMKELSPWNVQPKHLHGYFITTKGEFRLRAIDSATTELIGTTWYTMDVHPEWYWRLWTDYIVHTIHFRVLDGIAAAAILK